MKPVYTYNVIPSLPAPLERLRELTYNLRWAWNHDAIELVRRFGGRLWEKTGHKPVLMLGKVDQSRLEAVPDDEAFLAHLAWVNQDLGVYLHGDSTWFRRAHPDIQTTWWHNSRLSSA